MINLLKSIFGNSGKERNLNGIENNTAETKKCLQCLRRVNIEAVRCPHCRSDNFQF